MRRRENAKIPCINIINSTKISSGRRKRRRRRRRRRRNSRNNNGKLLRNISCRERERHYISESEKNSSFITK